MIVERAAGPAVFLAVVVFLLNIGAAWWVVYESTSVIARPLVGVEKTATSEVLSRGVHASPNEHFLLNHVVDAELLLRTSQNWHTTAVIAMSAAFSLIALGFALFVMGAEGAFSVEGNISEKGSLVLKSTAPGLLCFVLATVIIGVSTTSKVTVSPANYDLAGESGETGRAAKNGKPADDEAKPKPPRKPSTAGQ